MASSKVERKLAAIMFTDITGYTALSAKDETKALKLLDIQKQILTPIIEEFNGTLHKEMGDGLLFTFPTVTEAVKCGIKIQEQTKANDDLNLRIGIHEGEISLKDGDVLGDDVNVSSRIEPFSAVGGIAISGKVQQNISSLTDFETKYIGKPKLKGVAQEVKVYCITSHGLPETDISKVSAKLEKGSKLPKFALFGGLTALVAILFFLFTSEEEEKVPSIAIIPLENKGESKDDFYSYGISADLISNVSGAGDIRVASLKDVEKLDYKSLTNSEIAKKLYVRYISQGTLWKVDSIFQLSMELFDTKEGKVKWSNNWQQDWSELPSIKGGLSEKILTNLQVTTKQDITKSESQNAEAYELYLKAKNIYKERKDVNDKYLAVSLLEKAIKIDPLLKSALKLLGNIYSINNEGDKVLSFYQLSLEYAQQKQDSTLIAEFLHEMGHFQADHSLSFDYYYLSLEIFENINDKNGIINVLNTIADLYRYKDQPQKALEYYNKSLLLSLEFGSKSDISTIYRMAAPILSKNDSIKTHEYLQKALKYAKDHGDKYQVFRCLMNLGWSYQKLENYNSALDIFNEALKVSEELNDIKLKIQVLGVFLEFEKKNGNYVKSLEKLNFIFKLAGNQGSTTDLGPLFLENGAINMLIGDYKKSEIAYLKSDSLANKLDSYFGIINTNVDLGLLLIQMNDYDRALTYLEKNHMIFESASEYMREHIMQTKLMNSTLLYFIYKNTGKDYFLNEISDMIEEVEKPPISYWYSIPYELYYYLYQLFEESRYIAKAHLQIKQKVIGMEKEFGEIFLTYPIPKAIIEEWEKVSKVKN